MSHKRRVILGIETSNPSAWIMGTQRPGVALLIHEPDGAPGASPLIIRADIDPQAFQQDQLMSAVETAAREANVRPRDIMSVGVSLGPGGFTAVRVGVMVAKMICEVTGASCVGVPTADAVVARFQRDPASEDKLFVASVLASKGAGAFITTHRRNDSAQDFGGAVARFMFIVDVLKAVSHGEWPRQTHLIGDRFTPGPIIDAVLAAGGTVSVPAFDAATIATLTSKYLPVDPAALVPLYPREPEAVTKWRALHGAR